MDSASTGNDAMDDAIDIDEFRRILSDRKQSVSALIDATAEARKPVTLDQEAVGRVSRIDAMQRQAMALATRRGYDRELQKIEAAFRRMDAGDFGYCVNCGEQVARSRLHADPTAAACIDCASGHT